MFKHDKEYLELAKFWGQNSYSTRSKVGCIIVKNRRIISDGYNGTISGHENKCEDENGNTMPSVLHAESNAISKVARSTESSEGSTLYVALSPCLECSKLIIQAGIVRVVYSEQYRITEGLELLKKANVELFQIKL